MLGGLLGAGKGGIAVKCEKQEATTFPVMNCLSTCNRCRARAAKHETVPEKENVILVGLGLSNYVGIIFSINAVLLLDILNSASRILQC